MLLDDKKLVDGYDMLMFFYQTIATIGKPKALVNPIRANKGQGASDKTAADGAKTTLFGRKVLFDPVFHEGFATGVRGIPITQSTLPSQPNSLQSSSLFIPNLPRQFRFPAHKGTAAPGDFPAVFIVQNRFGKKWVLVNARHC